MFLQGSAIAQESIFDSENPNVVIPDSEDEEPTGPESIFDTENPNVLLPNSGDEENDGVESIFDLQNPNVQADGEQTTEPSFILDPENTGYSEASSSSTSPGPISRSYFSGDYVTRFYFDTGYESDLEDIFFFQNRLDLRGRLDVSENWVAVIEARLDHRLWGEGNPDGTDFFVNGEHYQGYFEPSLRDAFVSGRLGDVFLSVGNQAVVWGAGTMTAPADIINPSDRRSGVFDTPADQRVPTFAVESSVIFDRLSLSAVVVPFFEPDRMDMFGTDFALLGREGGIATDMPFVSLIEGALDPSVQPRLQSALAGTEFPEALPENVSAGVRIASTYGGVDLGVGYFFGWDRTPMFDFDEDLTELLGLMAADAQFLSDYDFFDFAIRNSDVLDLMASITTKMEAGGELLRIWYKRRHTVEADLVTYFGSFGLRLESAFSPERVVLLEDLETMQVPIIDSALALTYEHSENFNIQVEGFWSHVFDAPPDKTIALTGEDYYGVATIIMLGLDVFEALKNSRVGDITFRIGGIVGLDPVEFILYPSVAWAVTDAANLSIGVMIFEGPDLDEEITLGGLYNENDQAFISFDVAF